MTSSAQMPLRARASILVACVVARVAADVVITGEVSFDLRVANDNGKRTEDVQKMLKGVEKSLLTEAENSSAQSSEEKTKEVARKADDVKDSDDSSEDSDSSSSEGDSSDTDAGDTDGGNSTRAVARTDDATATAALTVACDYQYPARRHTDALLSNMMNKLTKMFVRLSLYMRHVERSSAEHKRRFRTVLADKRPEFFEKIYFNMSDEFRRASNSARRRVRGLHGPLACAHQRRLRSTWAGLLRAALSGLRAAALRVLRWQAPADGHVPLRSRDRADAFLQRELASAHGEQLTMLCDKFKLCYHDLVPPQLAMEPSSPENVSIASTTTQNSSLPSSTPTSSLAAGNASSPLQRHNATSSSSSVPRAHKSPSLSSTTSSSTKSPNLFTVSSTTPQTMFNSSTPNETSTTIYKRNTTQPLE